VTYPQQPYPPQPGYPPQAPADPYAPPQPPAPAPQYAPQPGYPAPGTAYAPPPQQYYAPPPAPAGYQPPYPPQPYAPPEPPAPLPTVSDFFSQPASGGGKALSFNVVGTVYRCTVVRDVTDADMEHAKELGTRPGMQGAVARHPDGREKVNMKVPVLLDQPTAEYPTGIAVWYVKANERSELLRAMQAAGAPAGPPRGGDRIEIAYTHDEPSRTGFNPRKVKRVTYTAGNGVAPQLPNAQPPQPVQPVQQPYGYGQVPQVQPQYAGWEQPPAGGQPGYAFPPAPAAAPGYAPSASQTTQPAGYAQQPQYVPAPQVQQPGDAYFGAVPNPAYQQPPVQPQFQQAPPPTTPGAPQGAPNGFTPGAQPTAAASPSNPGGPPPDWPADVPFIQGLTPDQARVAALHHIGQA
jgi:hypothetical protein